MSDPDYLSKLLEHAPTAIAIVILALRDSPKLLLRVLREMHAVRMELRRQTRELELISGSRDLPAPPPKERNDA